MSPAATKCPAMTRSTLIVNDYYDFTVHFADFVVFADGLGGNGGTVFVRWPGTGRPLLSDCAAKPAPEWSPHVPTTEVAAGATFCVISDQGRYGYILIQRATSSRDGGLNDVSLNFLLWKKQSDD
jgi:hypothetical protein